MPTKTEFATLLQDRLGVDSSYVTDGDLPASVTRYLRRFLRDYNFPKSLRLQAWEDIVAGTQIYALPAAFKKQEAVYFYDDTGATPAYGEPLLRREFRVLPESDGIARYYWITGTNLYTDITIDADSAGVNLHMIYQSLDPDDNETWMLSDLEDILFSFSMYRLSVELGKPELTKIWKPVWEEDRTAIAIYANELEYDDLGIVQGQPGIGGRPRYPAEEL